MQLTDPLESLATLLGLPADLPADPMPTLAAWMREAAESRHTPNPDAMVLATSSTSAVPSARVVLCKAVEICAGALVFYSNYSGLKGSDLAANPRAACVFHWDHAGRQARACGLVTRLTEEESDSYFRTRPLLSRLGAWASNQGRPIGRRAELVTNVRNVMCRFGVRAHHLVLPATCPAIPRPEFWGGYRIHLDMVELWVGGGGRLHDRALWSRSLGAPALGKPTSWHSTRIQP